jgi:hypothetical protein
MICYAYCQDRAICIYCNPGIAQCPFYADKSEQEPEAEVCPRCRHFMTSGQCPIGCDKGGGWKFTVEDFKWG